MTDDRPAPEQVELWLRRCPQDTLAREVRALREELERERVARMTAETNVEGYRHTIVRVEELVSTFRADAESLRAEADLVDNRDAATHFMSAAQTSDLDANALERALRSEDL